MRTLKKRFLSLLLVLVLTFISLAMASKKIILADYSSPIKTIETFYENLKKENLNIVSNCFYPPTYDGKVERFWIDYKIIEEKNTDKAGEKNYNNILIDKNAVEIIVEVEMIDYKKNNPKTNFWFLLQELNNEWKIIDYSHISDENYPPYD